ncbi:MAG: hypothetical protein J6V13_03865 [Paludibacteraceae bacterium]|nr:hypothetical protein [Paludibacteraceae bacterium]
MEEEVKKSNRDLLDANLRAKYPDIEDEDALYGKMMEDYDAEHEWAKKQRSDNARLSEAIQSSPELSAVFAEIYERGPEGHPELALLNMSDLFKGYMNGEISSEEYVAKKEEEAKANKTRDEKIAKQNEVFKAWCESKGYDPEEWMAQAKAALFDPMASYEVAEAQLDAIDKMIHYDEDVATAEQAGLVKGRNEKIVEKIAKEANYPSLPETGAGVKVESPRTDNRMSSIRANRESRRNL